MNCMIGWKRSMKWVKSFFIDFRICDPLKMIVLRISLYMTNSISIFKPIKIATKNDRYVKGFLFNFLSCTASVVQAE